MARSLNVFLLVLFFAIFVLGKEAKIEEKAKKLIAKNLAKEEAESESESESESDVDITEKKKANKFIAEIKKERNAKKSRKATEKDISTGLNQLAELKHKSLKSEVTEKNLAASANKIARQRARQTMVRVNDLDGNMVSVKLLDLERAAASSSPIVQVQTDTGRLTNIALQRARAVSGNTLRQLQHSATAEVEQALVEKASGSREDMDRLVNLLFKRIVRDHDKIAQRKAFARVESKMELKPGSLYKQYVAGVKTPTVPEKLNNTMAEFIPKEAAYGIINGMNLESEQEIPEAVRLMINREMRDEKRKEEEEANIKPTWTEFLFGK